MRKVSIHLEHITVTIIKSPLESFYVSRTQSKFTGTLYHIHAPRILGHLSAHNI